MEHIVVKKKKSHRTAVRWFAFLGWFLTMDLRHLSDDGILGFLLLVLLGTPLMLLLVYYEDWAITFYKGEIIRNRWNRLRRYSWADVQEVTSFRSATEGESICIHFQDGKTFQFRREDENAGEAVKLILKHTSIIYK